MSRDKSPALTTFTGHPPPIQVSVQQSRFAKDAFDAPKSKEVRERDNMICHIQNMAVITLRVQANAC